MKKYLRIFWLLGALGIGVALAITSGVDNSNIPLGSEMPLIKYVSKSDSGVVKSLSKPVVLFYFKPDCPHCDYELNVMNERHTELEHADIYCLTSDERYVKNLDYAVWTNLLKAGNVIFGFVRAEEYKNNLGIDATPVFYFFNEDRKLVEIIIGETKFDRILGAIRKSGDAQRRAGGFN